MRLGKITKSLAIRVFGGHKALADAIGIRPQTLSGWPEVLSPRLQDRIEAALHREGLFDDMRRAMRMKK